MRDNLFRRYINIFAGMLLVCTLLLGLAFLYFSAQNFSTDKRDTLSGAAKRARELVETGIADGGLDYLESEDAENGFRAIHDTSGATVLFTDPQGNVIFCSEGDNCIHRTPFSQKILERAISKGSYSSADYFSAPLNKGAGMYQFCVPVERDGNVVGFVFAMTSVNALYSFLVNLAITFLASAGVMLIGSVLIIYYSTKRLTRPLREMSSAARDFGRGDFSARVEVTGDDELANLASAFNNMADSLAELEKTRRSFIANVSHELRTPMTTIGGYIDGILDGTIPRARQEHYLTIVSDEVKRLSRLTSSLLDITRLEEGETKPALKNCNAWDVILSVMWNAEKRINDKKIEVVDLEVKPAFIMCDPDMLYQVIYNLIDNAVKFTPEGGRLSVRVEPQGQRTNIIIKNSGRGMNPEELQHIFERFYKTDKSRGLDKNGTGLGLYIVKTLVGRMDGVISATSELNRYTEFTVNFKSGVEEKGRQHKTSLPVFSTARPPVTVVTRKESWLKKIEKTIKKQR